VYRSCTRYPQEMAGDAVALTIPGSADDGCEKEQHKEELVTISGPVNDRTGGESSTGRSGDVWVHGPGGERYWGLFGAAGLLLRSPDNEILLQHRVEWSHFGGTWGIPGGARCEHESSISAALREAEEEAGVRGEHVRVRSTSVLDLGFWSYTTVIADATVRFLPCVRDHESVELRWIPIERVIDFPLHPRFADAWPVLLRWVRAVGPLASD